MLETLDYTIRIGSIPTFLYFDLYLYSAYAAHFVYCSYRVFLCDVTGAILVSQNNEMAAILVSYMNPICNLQGYRMHIVIEVRS